MGSRSKAVVGAVIAVAALAAAAWLAWPASLGGRTSYVTTHGVSMEPRFHTGDLAVLHSASAYRVGDVAAYQDHELHTLVMHRIVAVHDGHYTFKGDNNSWRDPETPAQSELVGKLALRIPQGGVWLARLTSPFALGVLVLLLAAGGSTTAVRRRRRGRRRVSRHAAPRSSVGRATSTLSPQLRTAVGATAAVAVAAIGLSVVAWTRPLDAVSTTTTKPARSMTFSYTATVPRTPAYDGTVVTAPDPVFRRLTNTVDVHLAYRGYPGRIDVGAVVSAPNGWHTAIPLSAPAEVDGTTYDADVHLDLTAIERRAQAAARVTGLVAAQLTVTVVTHVSGGSLAAFDPSVEFTLTPLQLALTKGGKGLTVHDSTADTQRTVVPRTLAVAGHRVDVAMARKASAGLLLLVLLLAGLLAVVSRRSAAVSEGARIRRRYAPLLLPVEPMPTPPGRPVVDVTEFKSLARLAERYDLLVLYWTRSGIDTFVVQDDTTTFRYRSGAVSLGMIPPQLRAEQTVDATLSS